jgi:predicted DNA-binding ribbon-helix-helix protein
MQSSGIKKRSIIIAKHKTSVSVEDEFWAGLREIAKGRGQNLSQVIADIDEGRQSANLSSAIRLFVLRYYRNQRDQQDKTVIPIAPMNGNYRGPVGAPTLGE